MMDVLLLAPTIDRDDVGEAWVAYQWASRLSQRYRLTVLTYRKRGHQSVTAQLPGARVIEWEEPALLGRFERLNSLLKPGYVAFYFHARKWIARALEQGENFDVAHQAVPVAMRYPSPLTKFSIPYVFGPVGGSLESPKGFDEEDHAPWYVQLRKLDKFRLAHDRALKATYERAACVVGIAPYVADLLSGLSLRRLEVMSETALDRLEPVANGRRARKEVRLLFVGRLVRTKGVRDLVRAMSHLSDCPVYLDIVGTGFDRESCERLARELGLDARVAFHGQKSRSEVQDFYRNADIFTFPSYREPGGNVAFEAMSNSLPLIVNDRGGPGFVVDDSCGIRVRAIEPGQYAIALAAAIRRLVVDADLRRSMGTAARRRAEQVALWEPKLDRMNLIYEEARNDARG